MQFFCYSSILEYDRTFFRTRRSISFRGKSRNGITVSNVNKTRRLFVNVSRYLGLFARRRRLITHATRNSLLLIILRSKTKSNKPPEGDLLIRCLLGQESNVSFVSTLILFLVIFMSFLSRYYDKSCRCYQVNTLQYDHDRF